MKTKPASKILTEAEKERRHYDAAERKVSACVVATEALRRRLIDEAEAWMAIRPVSASATYKSLPPPYARRNAAACLRAAALLAEVLR